MIWLCLEGVAKTAIALPRRAEAGNLYETLPEIPGTAVRGAFAGKYIRHQGWQGNVPRDEDGKHFEQWFESAAVRFGPLRPLPDGSLEAFDKVVPVPVPRSARSCKYEPGFADGHGVFDTLLFPRDDDAPIDEKLRKCPVCEAPLEPLDSQWLVANWNKEQGLDYDPIFRLNTHVGIGPAGEEDANLSDAGRLFSLQHFPAGTKFRGWIAIGDGEELHPKDLGFENGTVTLRVGRRSKSYGALTVSITGQSAQSPYESSHGSLMKRFDPFQAKEVKDQIKKAQSFPFQEEDFMVFILTCLTDLILLDDFLRPCRSLTAAQIACRLGMKWCSSEPSVWRAGVLTGTRLIAGWNAAHRLPKENESAITAGSVFLFAVRNDDWGTENLRKKLADWENKGLGWRRSEGFGQVLVCDPFHLQAERNFTRLKDEKEKSRPAVNLSAPSVKAQTDLKKSPHPFDVAVSNFFRQNRSVLFPNNRSVWSKTQVNGLRDRVQRYDRVSKSPKDRLRTYLKRKATLERTKQPLIQALIELFGLEDNKVSWEDVRRRVDDFVRAQPLFGEYPDLTFNANKEETQ